MDQSPDFRIRFQDLLHSLDESYLTGLSNKGIYKRSVKDLKRGEPVSCEYQPSAVEIKVLGETVRIPMEIKAFTCTCPSSRACRHLILGLMHLKENAGPDPCGPCNDPLCGPSDTWDEDRFAALKAIPVARIRKKLGKTGYLRILARIEYGIDYKIQEKSLLTVSFPDEGTAVTFAAGNGLENAVCSCKSSEFCEHRAEAVLCYQADAGIIDLAGLPGDETKPLNPELLAAVETLLKEGLLLGLSRVTQSMAVRFEQMAIEAHGAGLPYFEKELRALHSDLNLFLNKDAGFAREMTRKRWARLLNLVLVLKQHPDSPKNRYVAQNRSDYRQVPRLQLTGMGANPWMTSSGYLGVSYYFYTPRLKRVLTYSLSRPGYYDGARGYVKTIADLYDSDPPWGLDIHSRLFSSSVLTLTNAKLNQRGRLSSSTGSRAVISCRATEAHLAETGLVHADWGGLLTRLEKKVDLIRSPGSPDLFILEPAAWEKSTFDEITQIFCLPMMDNTGKRLDIRINFNAQNRHMIEQLETAEKQGEMPCRVFGSLNFSGHSLTFFPFTVYHRDGGSQNLGLDE